jgi:hypothetical protein
VEGQNIEHFRSESPGSGEAVCRQVQDELKATPELLLDGVLLVDRSFVSAGLFETVAVDCPNRNHFRHGWAGRQTSLGELCQTTVLIAPRRRSVELHPARPEGRGLAVR